MTPKTDDRAIEIGDWIENRNGDILRVQAVAFDKHGQRWTITRLGGFVDTAIVQVRRDNIWKFTNGALTKRRSDQ